MAEPSYSQGPGTHFLWWMNYLIASRGLQCSPVLTYGMGTIRFGSLPRISPRQPSGLRMASHENPQDAHNNVTVSTPTFPKP